MIPATPIATAMIAAYTVLVTNSPATRSMLAMTRRPSSSIRGMAAKVPSSSTTLATERLAWLPDPIATPRSACLRAWTSLTPSPTIATTCPAACSARTAASLWPGLTRPKTLEAASAVYVTGLTGPFRYDYATVAYRAG